MHNLERPLPATRAGPQDPSPAILSMCTTVDAAGTSVLMVSYVNDRTVRLYELPSFDGRGCLPNVSPGARRGGLLAMLVRGWVATGA